jgi:hypothetical protein
LISLGLQGLSFDTFALALRRHGVCIVLDLRVSSSFRGEGFSMEHVLALFEGARIRYRRLPSLVDRREDPGLSEAVRQRRYALFLEEQRDALGEIRASIRKGPAALLGWEALHAGSDRAVLVDALQRQSGDSFDLIVLP